MKLKVDLAGIKTMELRPFVKYIAWNQMSAQCFLWDIGKAHYRLLAYLSSQMPAGCTVSDLGTHTGASAIALAMNPNIKVSTYDTIQHVPDIFIETYRSMPNITFYQKDCRDAIKEISKSKLIYLDIAPHDGMQEQDVLDKLLALKYKGVVVCDDIHFNDAMEAFWARATQNAALKVTDISPVGSQTGTGIILFDPKTELEINYRG